MSQEPLQRPEYYLSEPDLNNNNDDKKNKQKFKKKVFFASIPAVGFFHDLQYKIHEVDSATVHEEATHGERQPLLPLNLDFNGQEKTHRSGKELWAILRDHVFHQSFHIHSDFKDTVRRREDKVEFDHTKLDLPYEFSVIECVLALAVYFGISVIAYSFVFEKWTIIDSLYFAGVVLTTCGYGDIAPTTQSGKLFFSFFALTGVVVLAIGLGVIGSKIVETEVKAITKAEENIAKEVFTIFKPTETKEERQRDFAKKSKTISSSFQHLSDFDDTSRSISDELKEAIDPWLSTRDACKQGCGLLMRYVPALFPLLLGGAFIGHYEGWTFIDILYYCVVTSTTIGLGDLTSERESLRLFAVFFIPLSVGAMGHFLGTIATFIMEQRMRVYDKKLWKHEITLEDLQTMGENCNGTVTELDFLIFMLKAMKKVDEELIDKVREHFRRLDLTHSGTLCRADLELMAQKKIRSARSKLRLQRYKAGLARKGSIHVHHSDSDLERMASGSDC